MTRRREHEVKSAIGHVVRRIVKRGVEEEQRLLQEAYEAQRQREEQPSPAELEAVGQQRLLP